MSAERWTKLYREWRGNPFSGLELVFPPGLIALLLALHYVGIQWWAASGLTSRPAYWLAVSWKAIPAVLLFWLWEAWPALLDLPGWLLRRRRLPTRVLDRREVPVLPERGALAYFIERGEPAAWKLTLSVAQFRNTKLAAKTELRCAACGALWTQAAESSGACFACRADKGVFAVHIPAAR